MDKQELIAKIISEEWKMFDQVNNIGGRASCQDNYSTFRIMRESQFLAWNEKMLVSYENDLREAVEDARNLVSEKYGFMMENTHPEEYRQIAMRLPQISMEKQADIDKIVLLCMIQADDFTKEYPNFSRRTRPMHAEEGRYFTSAETYLKCELKTYSEDTVKFYLEYLYELEKEGKRIVYMIFENMAHEYGFQTLREAESKL